jgi:hypothetical protein
MRRFLAAGGFAVLLALGGFAAASVASGHPLVAMWSTTTGTTQGKITICHHTHSQTNPFVTITISPSAWPAHQAHGDTMGACQNGEPKGATRLTTNLTAVAGATGSGTAVVDVRLNKKSALVCYTLNTTGVDATAAHIHTSTAQTIGGQSFAANAIVVPLKTPNGNGLARGCTKTSLAIGQALLANPSNFYVNVHSASFPGGQIQGTLALAP